MDAMKRFFRNLRSEFSGLNMNEYLVLLLLFSAFVSVFFLFTLMLLLPFYMVFTGQIKLSLPKRKSSYFLLLFAISAVISTFLHAQDADINGFLLKADLLKLLSIGIIILSFDIYFFENIMTKRVFYLGLKLCAFLSISSLAVGLVQNHLDIYANPLRPGRHASVFINENYYGTAIEFFVLITLFLLAKAKTKKMRIVYGLILFGNIFGLWLCQCRTAFVVVACTVFIFLIVFRKKYSFVFLGFIALATITLIINPSLLPRFDTIRQYADFRFGIWNAALKCFMDHPIFGCGYFSYSNIWKEYSAVQYFALHAHNLYLEVLLNFGLIGTSLIGIFSGLSSFQSIRNCVSSHKKEELALVVSAIAAVLLHGLLDTTLFWPQTGIFAVYLITLPKVYTSSEDVK